jgi:hypothetical protein
MNESTVGQIWSYINPYSPNRDKEYYLVLKAQYDWSQKYYIYDLMYLEDGMISTDVEYGSPLEWMDDCWKREA